MIKPTVLAATALLALTACDRMPFGQGGANETAAASATTANASANTSASDAGVTSSRSLAGLMGGNSSGGDTGGGKDPAGAVQAGSNDGVIDPRLVGSWSDSGTCKDAAELRADGTFVAHNGATGRWSLVGNQLVFRGNGGEFRLQVESIQPDRISVTDSNGQRGGSIRC